MTDSMLARLRGGLIVSCQARHDSPLGTPEMLATMARAAELGGAIGIRADGSENIRAIKSATSLPLIGIQKVQGGTGNPLITPAFADAAGVVTAGADLIAIEVTDRLRATAEETSAFISRVHDELGVPVMADVDSLHAGLRAQAAGADVVATTLSGYTNAKPPPDGPDVGLVRALVRAQPAPVIAEGRVWTREQVSELMMAGAYAIVVGTAITNPILITRRLAPTLPVPHTHADAAG